MGTGFRRSGDGVSLRLDRAEAELLKSLVEQLAGLVGGEQDGRPDDPLERALDLPSGPVTKPEDPVLARLFPDAYAAEEEAGEFRRYTEGSLRDGKLADASVVLETAAPGRVSLSAEQAGAWLRALNDVRLALGTRLDVTEEIHDEVASMSEEDPRYAAFVTYDWLTYLQDTLVRALW